MTTGEQRGRGGILPPNVTYLQLHLNLNLLCHLGQSHHCPCRNHCCCDCHGNCNSKCCRRHRRLRTQCCTCGRQCLAPVRCRGTASSRGGCSGSQPARQTLPRGRWSMGTSRCHVPRILACHCSRSFRCLHCSQSHRSCHWSCSLSSSRPMGMPRPEGSEATSLQSLLLSSASLSWSSYLSAPSPLPGTTMTNSPSSSSASQPSSM